ncbi:glycosyltransferase family 2 protein [Rhodohalobacter sulfatireducens]|uniref:Glycosyltransferase family 2 protein n=1 Tax=Rhodohalobacter sulfatireducens TaxID=2911366 RepID=A0ABS9KB28_9BACT|nr:glycosyltransferase family 2 protein [Rhodohalobacter sulfatireducens]
MQHSFSIIIVTWNALEHLQRFLPSVAATDYSDFEVIIANNASEDSTAEWIKTNYPECKVITYDRNYGYAAGNNRAVKYASGEILVFLNNDVKTEPHWLDGFDNVFQDRSVGIAQPKLRSVEDPEYFEYAGAAGGYIDWMGYPFCRGRLIDKVEKDEGQYDERSEIFWATGAAFAIRKELFIKAGGFDEDFEFHMEEIDLCWRCLKIGLKIQYVPNSTVYHLGGGSLPHGSPRKVFFNYRNSLLMLLKNLDRFIIPKIFFRLILDGISGVRSLLKGKPAETWAIIRAHFSFYGMIPTTLSKRTELKKKSTTQTPKNLVLMRLLIMEYFFRGKKTFNELEFSPNNN